MLISDCAISAALRLSLSIYGLKEGLTLRLDAKSLDIVPTRLPKAKSICVLYEDNHRYRHVKIFAIDM
jgi:hypothetical protein